MLEGDLLYSSINLGTVNLSLGDMPCYGGGGSYICQYVINHIYVYQITIILMISRLVEGHRRKQIRI